MNILIAPLDWGLGHSTRIIPIIKALLNGGYNVLIATNGKQETLLKQEFPQIQFIQLKGYNIEYATSKSLLPLKLFIQIPKIFSVIISEHQWLKKIIVRYQIDLIISDNRFGLFNSKIPSVFITHQLQIQAPYSWTKKWLRLINYQFIQRFTCCWIPDNPSPNGISGELGHPSLLPKLPLHYIGLPSRFTQVSNPKSTSSYKCCFLISGPEPQRTLLENIIFKDLQTSEGNYLIIRGLPGNSDVPFIASNITVFNHLGGDLIQKAISDSDYIVSRSGYTSLMELFALKKKTILIPTPGQTEQEYLAKELMNKGISYTVLQENFNVHTALYEAKNFTYSNPPESYFSEKHILQLVRDLLHN